MAIVCGAIGLSISQRNAAIEDFRTAAINLGGGMAQRTTQLFGATLDALAGARPSLATPMAPNDVQTGLVTARLRQTLATAFSLAGETGQIEASTGGQVTPPADLLPRLIQHLRDGGTDEPAVSEPVREPGSGRWFVFLARRLTGADGRFAGAAIAEIDLSALADFYRMAMPSRRAMTLARNDGLILLRHPWAEAGIGQTISPDSPWNGARLAGGGTYAAAGLFDGKPAIAAVIPLPGLPLVVETSVEEAVALGNWTSQRNWLIGGCVLAILCVILLVYVAVAQLRLSEASERRLAGSNAQLETARRRLDIALGNISQGLCFFDGRSRLILSNRRYAEVYGLDPDAIRPGMTLADIVALRFAAGSAPDTTQAEYLDAREQVARSEGLHRSTIALRNGRTISILHQPMPDGGWVATHEDITAYRRVEAESQAKSTFLAVMSHEIRTPMNGVLGLVSTLRDTPLSEDQRQVVDAIHHSGADLLRILNDILDISKLNAGQMTLDSSPFCPADVTSGVLATMAAHAAAKDLALRFDPRTSGLMVLGDAGRIRQVLLNLISNAIKFTDRGEVSIALTSAPDRDGRIALSWSIRDTGIGIPAERIEAVFADFAQTDSSISRRFGGTGLGLPISRRLVEHMGGTLRATSEPGQGSRFYIELSLPAASDAILPSVRPGGLNENRFRTWLDGPGRQRRILLAEDNRTNQMVVRRMLRGYDLALEVVENGRDAVEMAARFEPDVICMDVQMPERDGLEATRSIRASTGPGRLVPIVAMTANAFPEDARTCFEAGMNAFVAKPINKPGLLGAIMDAIDAAGVPETKDGQTEGLAA